MKDPKTSTDTAPKKTTPNAVPNDNRLLESQQKNINPKTGQNINKFDNNPSERRL